MGVLAQWHAPDHHWERFSRKIWPVGCREVQAPYESKIGCGHGTYVRVLTSFIRALLKCLSDDWNRYLEFAGKWRLGLSGQTHLSLSHKSGSTAMAWDNTGMQYPGPLKSFGLWNRSSTAICGDIASTVHYGSQPGKSSFVKIGNFRIAEIAEDTPEPFSNGNLWL